MAYKDKDRQREFQKQWRAAIRNKYIAHLGGKCVLCESTNQLEFDHIDSSKKTMNPTRLWSRKEEVILAELQNMQLLCYDCHKEKTLRERREKYTLPSCGEYAMYKRGCRCDLCKAANAARSRKQRGRD